MHLANAFKFNSFHLKLIAAFFMLVDHIAYFLIPQTEPIYWVMRIVGRISAPLFWFCFVEGYKHTSNRAKYAARLAIATILMMVGNSLVNALIRQSVLASLTLTSPNIFFSFLLMTIIIELLELGRVKIRFVEKSCYLLTTMIVALIVGFHAEYGWHILFSVLCLYFLQNDSWKYITFVVINLLICAVGRSFIQIFMILAVLFMMMYRDKKPKQGMKWFFYVFYPIHMWVLLLLSNV